MGKICKSYALALILLMAVSSLTLLMVKPVSAQSVPTPNFSINPFIDSAISTFNVTITVQNNPQTTAYLLAVKIHYYTTWNTVTLNEYNITSFASSGPQTVLTLYGNIEGEANQIYLQHSNNWGMEVPFGDQLDFQLASVSGHVEEGLPSGLNYVGNMSDWSAVQSITVPYFSTASTVSPNPTQTPTSTPSLAPFPDYGLLVVLPVFLILLSIALILQRRKTAKT
jgi:hypothetical protein